MFVFYIQQLQRDLLLGSSLEVTDFAGFVAHIFWQEPGNFALVNLLQTPGLLKEICVSRETLCLVLCHFFCRRPLEPWLLRRLWKRFLVTEVDHEVYLQQQGWVVHFKFAVFVELLKAHELPLASPRYLWISYVGVM